MSLKKPTLEAERNSARMIFTLPKALASELEEFARILRGGNKSGFVADALRSYINYFRKQRHTRLLRQSYAAASEHGRAVAAEWDSLADEAWEQLSPPPKRRARART